MRRSGNQDLFSFFFIILALSLLDFFFGGGGRRSLNLNIEWIYMGKY